jgi:mono/diheme cytochrome c family protein
MVGAGLLAFSQAEAQTFGDTAAGRTLAQRWCSSCHMVDAGQPNALATGVPTFVGIARMPSTTALSLRVFLQTPHVRMPDLHLTQEEIGDVTAYILSLKAR